MCINYKSADDFVNNVLVLVSPSFFGDICKYVNEFINGMSFYLPENFFLFESKSLLLYIKYYKRKIYLLSISK